MKKKCKHYVVTDYNDGLLCLDCERYTKDGFLHVKKLPFGIKPPKGVFIHAGIVYFGDIPNDKIR